MSNPRLCEELAIVRSLEEKRKSFLYRHLKGGLRRGQPRKLREGGQFPAELNMVTAASF